MRDLGDTLELLRALAEPTRVRLLALLSREELSVAELTEITRLPQSRVSTHLARLREVGLVRDRREGTSAFYSLAATEDAIRRLWEPVVAVAQDPLLAEDQARLAEALAARGGPDPAARIGRGYSPGRTWEALVRASLGLVRLGHLLDVACGDSWLSQCLAPRCRSVTGLDASPRALRTASRRVGGAVRFVQGDMHRLPFRDQSFDAVLLLAALDYADEPGRVVGEASRVLRPGGLVAGSALLRHSHPDVVAAYGHRQQGFDPSALAAELAAAGLVVELCEPTVVEPRAPHLEVVSFHARRRSP